MPGCCQDQQIADRLEWTDWDSIDLGMSNRRENIVARNLDPGFDQWPEITPEVRENIEEMRCVSCWIPGQGLVRLNLFVLTPKKLLRKTKYHRRVFLRNSQNTQHHPKRKWTRDIADKFAIPSQLDHTIQAIPRETPNAILQ